MPRLVVIVLVLVLVLVLDIERALGLCVQNDPEREPGLLQRRWARTNRFRRRVRGRSAWDAFS
jgi:hypothetical protein